MKVLVKIVETYTVERTYEVDGVNDFTTAAKCAERCYNKQFQPNAYMRREVPQQPTYQIDSYEVIKP